MQAAASGLIINSMGWVVDLGYDLLLHTIRTLRADIVLVLGDDRLYANLQQHCRYVHSSLSPSLHARKGGARGLLPFVGLLLVDNALAAQGRCPLHMIGNIILVRQEHVFGPAHGLQACPQQL